MTLNIGPQHPSTHGVLRLIVELDGETVVKLVPDVGYLHRGIGKIAETLHYEQFLPYTDRLDYLASFINNLGWAMAAERLFGIEPPPRANYLRVLLSELARIESHLIWLGTHLLDLGAITPLFYCFREKEEIRDLFEEICGARMTHAFCRIGGVREDVTPAFLPAVRRFAANFPKAIGEYEALITDNPIFRRAHPRRRRHLRGDGDRLRPLRPEPARLRRRLGPAQGRALRGLRGAGLRGARRRARRRLRPLPRAHGGDAPEPAPGRADRGEPPRGAGARRRAAVPAPVEGRVPPQHAGDDPLLPRHDPRRLPAAGRGLRRGRGEQGRGRLLRRQRRRPAAGARAAARPLLRQPRRRSRRWRRGSTSRTSSRSSAASTSCSGRSTGDVPARPASRGRSRRRRGSGSRSCSRSTAASPTRCSRRCTSCRPSATASPTRC